MNNRIPTSASDFSYIGAIQEPAAIGAPAVSQGQRIVATSPAPARTRTRAQHTGSGAGGAQPSLDLDMLMQLISPAAYRDVTRSGASFRGAMRALKSVLEDSRTALLRNAGAATEDARSVKAIEAAERLVSEICGHGDTLDIYINCAPKLG